MSATARPGYVPNYVNYVQGQFPNTAAIWTQALYKKASEQIADAITSGLPYAEIPGFGRIYPTDMGQGGNLSLDLTRRLSSWANDEETASNQDVVKWFGGPRPTPQPDDWVPSPELAQQMAKQAAADADKAQTSLKIAMANATYSGGGGGVFGRSAGVSGGVSDNSPGQASPDAQLSASLRREELTYQKEKDALDRAMARAQVIAQLGQNPADAVQREIFLRTGMEPVGQTTNVFSGAKGPNYTTLSQNMQNMANQGVFGQAPTLPAGTAPMVPYAGQAPAYAQGTEITPDGWTTAQTFIAGDPRKPWEVNPERIDLRVVDGKPQAKVTPIHGPKYHQIASMSHGTNMYAWGSEGNSVPTTPPASGTNPATGETNPAPAYDPTRQYYDAQHGKIVNIPDWQLRGLTQTQYNQEQWDEQQKAGAAYRLLQQGARFTSGISTEELTRLQELANKYDSRLVDLLRQRNNTWRGLNSSDMYNPSLVGYPVVPATRQRGQWDYFVSKRPTWGGEWTAPTPPPAPPVNQNPMPRPTTPVSGTQSQPPYVDWGSEGSLNQNQTQIGSGNRPRWNPNYAYGTTPMYEGGTLPSNMDWNDPYIVSFKDRVFWNTDTVTNSDGTTRPVNETDVMQGGEFKGMTYGDAYAEMMRREQNRAQGGIDYDSMTNAEREAYNVSQLSADRNLVDPATGKKKTQSLFPFLPNYEDPNMPVAPGATPTTFGTTAATQGGLNFGNTGLKAGQNAQFVADQNISYKDIKTIDPKLIQIWDPATNTWKRLAENQTIQQGQTVYIGLQAPGEVGGAKTLFIDGKSVPAAALFDQPNGTQVVTGEGAVPLTIGTGKDQIIMGYANLQRGDYKLADGSYVRYDPMTKRWLPLSSIDGSISPVVIDSEKKFLELPETVRQQILSGKPTTFNFMNPTGSSMDWMTNYFVGLNSFTPRPQQLSKEEFAKLPQPVRDALVNGTDMPEGYEQYAQYAGFSGGPSYGNVNYSVGGAGLRNLPYGGMTTVKQLPSGWTSYDYSQYQNESSPPGPAMAGHHWEYIDPQSGTVVKRVR